MWSPTQELSYKAARRLPLGLSWRGGRQVSLTVSIGRGFNAATQLPSIFQFTGSVGTVHPHTRIFNHSC